MILTPGPGLFLHLEFDKGEHLPFSVTAYNSAGSLITTISSARLGFFTGSIKSPTAAFTSPGTVTVTVTSSTTMSFTLTATMTRTFTVGSDYCWLLEMTLSDGSILTVFKGNVEAFTEIIS